MPGAFTHYQPPFGCTVIKKIQAVGLPSTIDFTNIPQQYTDLKIIFTGRDSGTGTGLVGLSMQMNGDATSGNYTFEQFVDSGATGATILVSNDAASASGAFAGFYPGTSGLATAVGTTEILIPAYTGVTFPKIIQFLTCAYYSVTPIVRIRMGGFVWKSTAPINRLKLTASTTFAVGTVATLYGLG